MKERIPISYIRQNFVGKTNKSGYICIEVGRKKNYYVIFQKGNLKDTYESDSTQMLMVKLKDLFGY